MADNLEQIIMTTENPINIIGYSANGVTRHAEPVNEYVTLENTATTGNFDLKWRSNADLKPEGLVITFASVQTVATQLAISLINVNTNITKFTINVSVENWITDTVLNYIFPSLLFPANRIIRLVGNGNVTSLMLCAKRVKIIEQITPTILD